MSEKINFIPVADLPQAEGNDLQLLCVENGEMKQKDTAGMGLTADIFANITVTNYVEGHNDAEGNWVDGYYEFTVSDEKLPTYAQLREMLMNGVTPKSGGLVTVVPCEDLIVPQYQTVTGGYIFAGVYNGQNLIQDRIWAYNFEVDMIVFEDGTVEWYLWD